MIENIEILIISVLQGIGEFLPISSSGHNAVAYALFDLNGKKLPDFIQLNILLHLGTLFAVFIVFQQRIIDLLTKDRRLIALLIVATVPGAVVGLAIKEGCPDVAKSLWVTSLFFPVTGILLLMTLRAPQGEKTCSTMSFLDALIIGCVQAIAVLPGLSRSGSTIVAALFCKLRRDEAATFSFLLSIPIIAGSGIFELKDLIDPDKNAAGGSSSPWLLLVAVLTSCLVGIVALLWVVDWLKKGKLWYFAVWVFVMCPFTLWLAHQHHLAGTPVEPPSVKTSSDETQTVETSSDEAFGFGSILFGTFAVETSSDEALPNETPSMESASIENTTDEKEEYEKMRAEEEAQERALIEEEKKRIPLVDEPETLILLDPNDRIWVTKDGKSVVLLGRIALREGMLELFACRIASKEYESIVSVRIKPYLIHAALIVIGAAPGKPMQMHPEFVPPSGDEIEVKVRWLDSEGNEKEALAQDWVLDNAKSTKNTPQAMSTHWVFTGSVMYKDEDGNEHYVADASGELFGLSNFVGAILDVPIQSTEMNDNLLFSCFTERIPEVGTPLTLILTPVKNKR